MNIILCSVLASVFMLFSGAAGEDAVKLQDALNKNMIRASATSTGSYTGEAVWLELQNRTNKAMTILIPMGTRFEPANEADQDIIVAREQHYALAPGATETIKVTGFCMEKSDRSPDEQSAFSIGMCRQDTLVQLLQGMQSGSYDLQAVQNAIWSVTDRQPVAHIYGEELEPLRKLVSELTGMENSWYAMQVSHTVTEDRRIVSAPVFVSGNFSYRSVSGQLLTARLIGPDGQKVADLGRGQRSPGDGNLTYYFKLSVEGFPAGEYRLQIMGDGELLQERIFQV